jgi:hypothetical protein
LVPYSREGLLPEFKYTPYTSEIAKLASRLLVPFTGVDAIQTTPAAIDNFIKGWTSGTGALVSQAVDFALKKAGIVPDLAKPAKVLEDLPFFRNFMVRYPSMNTKNIEDFFNRYQRNEAYIKTMSAVTKQEFNVGAAANILNTRMSYLLSLRASAMAIQNQIKFIRYVDYAPDMSSAQKREATDSAYIQANKIAAIANENAKRWEDLIKQQEK